MKNKGYKFCCISLLWVSVTIVSCTNQKVYNFLTDIDFNKCDYDYDTVQGYFLFERSIDAYHESDAIIKESGFLLLSDSIIKNLYMNGIYFIYNPFSVGIKHLYPNIFWDMTSLENAIKLVYYDREVIEKPIDSCINLFSGCIYDLFYLKIVYLKIGKLKQYVPSSRNFENSSFFNKAGINYCNCKRKLRLPTMVVTNVIEINYISNWQMKSTVLVLPSQYWRILNP
jgi:hypothetical protein